MKMLLHALIIYGLCFTEVDPWHRLAPSHICGQLLMQVTFIITNIISLFYSQLLNHFNLQDPSFDAFATVAHRVHTRTFITSVVKEKEK